MHISRLLLWAAPVCLVLLTGCGSSAKTTGPLPAQTQLKGAGATFPNYAYTKWIEEYKKEHPGLKFTWDAVGSAAGIADLQAGKVDFAGTDVPLTEAESAKFPAKPLLFPALAGAIVPVYHLPDVKGELKFSGEVIGRILAGSIKSWSDPAIAKINPGVTLPAQPIHVVRRPANSGSAQIVASLVTKSTPSWKGATAGEEALTSQALAEGVSKTAGAFGYVELNYAVQNKLAAGSVKNAAGEFVKANFESVGAGIDSLAAKNAYPMATLTYLVVPSKFEDTAKRDSVKKFLTWAYDINAGQKAVLAFDYNALPPKILDEARAQVDRIQ